MFESNTNTIRRSMRNLVGSRQGAGPRLTSSRYEFMKSWRTPPAAALHEIRNSASLTFALRCAIGFLIFDQLLFIPSSLSLSLSRATIYRSIISQPGQSPPDISPAIRPHK